MRAALTGRAVAAGLALALTALGVNACSSQPNREKPDPAPSVRHQDNSASSGNGSNSAYKLPDTPFTRGGTVVTATCVLGARYAAVSVQAWDPERWTVRSERFFPIPTDAALGNYTGVKAVNSPLVDLCSNTADAKSRYNADTKEQRTPRIRSLFDLGFTRMAVVLRDPGGKATHAAFVESDDAQDEVLHLNDATNADEQNAAMSPDGRAVWFTYTTAAGKQRIGSRAVDGDHHLSDEGPAAGHGLPLTVTGKPPRAVQADMVRVSPNGRRITASAPKVFGTIFDAPGSSAPLTAKTARNAILLGDCVGAVGWIDDTRVLCRTPSGTFREMDARTGRPAGPPISVVAPGDGTVAEGMLVSPDGKNFLASVHLPNDPYGQPGESADLRVVPTTPGGKTISLPSDGGLITDTVFLEWLQP